MKLTKTVPFHKPSCQVIAVVMAEAGLRSTRPNDKSAAAAMPSMKGFDRVLVGEEAGAVGLLSPARQLTLQHASQKPWLGLPVALLCRASQVVLPTSWHMLRLARASFHAALVRG